MIFLTKNILLESNRKESSMEIKIAFSGIGGVGGYYGGKLAHFYRQSENIKIYFISRGENLEVISREGLKIQTLHEEIIAHPTLATHSPKDIGPVDYLFCTTKSYDLAGNLEEIRPLIGPSTVIIPLLNGANITEEIRRLVPGHQVWYGCVYIGARLSAPGTVSKFTEQDRLWFGDPEGDRLRQAELLQLMSRAGISALNPADIHDRIWRKFFLISLSATLTSYYDQSIGEVLEFHRSGYEKLGEELYAVAQAQGIHLPQDMIRQVIADQEKMPYDATTSMHTDFRKHKPTELETLTGYVVESGKALHLPVPSYEMMYKELKTR